MNEPFSPSEEDLAAAETQTAPPWMQEEDALHPDSGNGHRPLPAIINSVDLIAQPLILPDLLIDGLLHKGSKMSLGGGSKTFKSWTFLSISVAITTGHHWLDFRTERAKVLLVNFEIHQSWLHKRLTTVCEAMNLWPEPGYLDFWNLRGYSAPHAIIMPQIIQRARDMGYGLVIIDPSYKLIGQGDENSASDVGAMMNSFELITVETDAAVMFGAHFAKGNAAAKESIDRISGSGVFARDPDTILTFTPHDQPNCFTVEATLRNLPQINPFVVEWKFPAFERQPDLNPADLKKRAGRPKSASSDDILALLERAPLTSSNWQKSASDELGISRGLFFQLKDSLSRNGKVIKSKINDCWTMVYTK